MGFRLKIPGFTPNSDVTYMFDFEQVTNLSVHEFPHSKMGLIVTPRVIGELNKIPYIKVVSPMPFSLKAFSKC